jgi:hypothetical protein
VRSYRQENDFAVINTDIVFREKQSIPTSPKDGEMGHPQHSWRE